MLGLLLLFNNFRIDYTWTDANKKQIKFIPLTSYKFSLNHLSQFISKKINNPIVLNFTRLHKPNLESQILANTMGNIVKNTRINFRRLILKIAQNTKIKRLNTLRSTFNFKYLKKYRICFKLKQKQFIDFGKFFRF